MVVHAGAAYVLGKRAIAALVYAKKVPEPVLILIAAVVGLALSWGS